MGLNPNWVYEASIIGAADGQAVNNVFHMVTVDPAQGANDVTLENLLTAIQLRWRTNVLVNLSSAYKVLFYRVKEIAVFTHGVDPAPGTFSFIGQAEKAGDVDDDAGGVAGAWLPTYVAVNMRKRVLQTGRRFHGAMRFSPILEADTASSAGNALTDTAKNAWETAAAALRSNISAIGTVNTVLTKICLFHQAYTKKKNPASGNAREFADILTSTSINRNVGSQTSRKKSNKIF